MDKKTVLVIHGGAGANIEAMSPAEVAERTEVLTQSLNAGQTILQKGGTSLDAVVAAVMVMEDSPLFNAGKGAVFTHEGKNELDASIMCGKTFKAGAVGVVTTIKNPIKAAELVMNESSHVLLVGSGAERFAKDGGLEMVDPSYFHTDFRYQQLQEALKKGEVVLDHSAKTQTHKHTGTVGAVALDVHGNLASATTTGGMTNKKWGRVGDTAIIGAGTYADNESIAMSATGTGDVFVQVTAGHELSSLYKYKGLSVEESTKVVLEKVVALKGMGGIIALDAKGNYTLQMTTTGMFRGVVEGAGSPRIYTFREDK